MSGSDSACGVSSRIRYTMANVSAGSLALWVQAGRWASGRAYSRQMHGSQHHPDPQNAYENESNSKKKTQKINNNSIRIINNDNDIMTITKVFLSIFITFATKHFGKPSC